MDLPKNLKNDAPVTTVVNVTLMKHSLEVDGTKNEKKRKRESNLEKLKGNNITIVDLEISNNEDLFDLESITDLKIDEDQTTVNANLRVIENLKVPDVVSVECVKEKRKNEVKLLKRARVYSLIDEIDKVNGETELD